MTRAELARELEQLAESLERAIPLCTTRIEHLRVTAHASHARRLAESVRETS